MLILQVVLGCPDFLPPVFWGGNLLENRGTEPSVQEESSPEMNRKGFFSRFYMMRALVALACLNDSQTCQQFTHGVRSQRGRCRNLSKN